MCQFAVHPFTLMQADVDVHEIGPAAEVREVIHEATERYRASEKRGV